VIPVHVQVRQRVPRAGLALLIALFVLLAGLYSVLVPAFETPDEIWHYAFIQHWPRPRAAGLRANTQALWRQQGVQAPGYYLAAAALTALIDQSDFPRFTPRANPHAAIGRPDATANRNYLLHHAAEDWPWHGRFWRCISPVSFRSPGCCDAVGHLPGACAHHGLPLGTARRRAGRLIPQFISSARPRATTTLSMRWLHWCCGGWWRCS